MVSVEDILKMPILSNCRVISGLSGLNRSVHGWNVAERIDFHLWVKGGEFIMTMMSFVSENTPDEDIASWVQSLLDSGASALGIKKSVYGGTFPQFLLEMGDWNSFPIIEMDDKISLPEVGETIFNHIIAGKSDSLKKALDLFTATTVATVEGWVPAFVQELSVALGNPVLIETANMHLVSASGYTLQQENQALSARRALDCVTNVYSKLSRQENYQTVPMWKLRFIEHRFSAQNDDHRQLTFPIEVGGHLYGYISVIEVNKDFDVDDMLLLRVAINTAALIALRDPTYDIQDEIRYELFSAIIDPGRRAEAEERAKLYGFDYSTPTFCLIAQAYDPNHFGIISNEANTAKLIENIQLIDPNSLIIRHRASIIIFCHIFDEPIDSVYTSFML